MSEEGLPKEFDVVVIGTGVTESIVSAAVSRNGHTVLHLDPREYYGSFWATLNFKDWTAKEFTAVPPPAATSEFTSQDKLTWKNICENAQDIWYLNDEGVKTEFDKNNRRFNIDVCPQVVLAREELIELLISSNVSRYLEFLRVGKLFTSLPPPNENVVESIPLSRSDIFTSKSVGLAEKRTLVKFIEAILKPENEAEAGDEGTAVSDQIQPTFDEMVKNHKLSSKVTHLIRNAVETVEDGFQMNDKGESNFNSLFVPRCKKYLQSIGRFGNQTPYLWSLYGISEICQAFCRLSAVYGGLFILNRYISHIEEVEDRLKIKSKDDEFLTKHLVIGPELQYLRSGEKINRKISKTVGRGVIVTDGGSIKMEDGGKVTAKDDGIFLYKIGRLQVIELNHSSQAIPKNYKLLQITFPFYENEDKGNTSTKEAIEEGLKLFIDFQPTVAVSGEVDAVETDNNDGDNPTTSTDVQKPVKPRAIYGSYFTMNIFEDDDHEIPQNNKVWSCTVNSTEITAHILKAKAIFNNLYPGEEFLPKVPEQGENEVDDEASGEPEINDSSNNMQTDEPPPSNELGDSVPSNPL